MFAEPTEIEIFNLKGQKMKNLPVILSGVEGQGNEFNIIWNGTNQYEKPVSSEIYHINCKLMAKPKLRGNVYC